MRDASQWQESIHSFATMYNECSTVYSYLVGNIAVVVIVIVLSKEHSNL